MDIFKRFSIGDIVNEEPSGGRSVVRPRDGLESFLPGGVPDLQLDWVFVDVHDFGPEFDPDGDLISRVELGLHESEQQTALSHAW